MFLYVFLFFGGCVWESCILRCKGIKWLTQHLLLQYLAQAQAQLPPKTQTRQPLGSFARKIKPSKCFMPKLFLSGTFVVLLVHHVGKKTSGNVKHVRSGSWETGKLRLPAQPSFNLLRSRAALEILIIHVCHLISGMTASSSGSWNRLCLCITHKSTGGVLAAQGWCWSLRWLLPPSSL